MKYYRIILFFGLIMFFSGLFILSQCGGGGDDTVEPTTTTSIFVVTTGNNTTTTTSSNNPNSSTTGGTPTGSSTTGGTPTGSTTTGGTPTGETTTGGTPTGSTTSSSTTTTTTTTTIGIVGFPGEHCSGEANLRTYAIVSTSGNIITYTYQTTAGSFPVENDDLGFSCPHTNGDAFFYFTAGTNTGWIQFVTSSLSSTSLCSFPTALAVGGTCLGDYFVCQDNSAFGFYTNSVMLTATAGFTYHIMVGGGNSLPPITSTTDFFGLQVAEYTKGNLPTLTANYVEIENSAASNPTSGSISTNGTCTSAENTNLFIYGTTVTIAGYSEYITSGSSYNFDFFKFRTGTNTTKLNISVTYGSYGLPSNRDFYLTPTACSYTTSTNNTTVETLFTVPNVLTIPTSGTFISVIPNSDYYVFVKAVTGSFNNSMTDYRIAITGSLSPYLGSGDDCANVIDVNARSLDATVGSQWAGTSGTPGNFYQVFGLTRPDTSNINGSGSCGVTGTITAQGKDIIFKFRPTGTNNTLDVENTCLTGSAENTRTYMLVSNSCGGTNITCSCTNSTSTSYGSCVTASQSYNDRLIRFQVTPSTDYYFTIKASSSSTNLPLLEGLRVREYFIPIIDYATSGESYSSPINVNTNMYTASNSNTMMLYGQTHISNVGEQVGSTCSLSCTFYSPDMFFYFTTKSTTASFSISNTGLSINDTILEVTPTWYSWGGGPCNDNCGTSTQSCLTYSPAIPNYQYYIMVRSKTTAWEQFQGIRVTEY